MKIDIKKLSSNATIPTYGSNDAAGADLYAALDSNVTIQPHTTAFIGTKISVAIPAGFAGFIYARSGLASKRGLAPANKVGVIDSDYRGEIIVALHNHSDIPASVENGERIAQMVIAPYVTADFAETVSLDNTSRGIGGFGSTGSK